MRRAHTVEQVRAAEEVLLARLPEGALMQRAAAGLAYAVLDLLGVAYGRRVLLLVGGGNNGGDALYAGAMLARRGVAVEAVLLDPERAHAAGLAAFGGAGGRVVADAAAAHRPDLVVDGIVGIGGKPGLRKAAEQALDAVVGVPVVAVDTPSGVDVDTGRCAGSHVTAAVTVTFGTHKVCHLVDPAAQACGAVHLVDLGLDLPEPEVVALQQHDVAALIPRPDPDAHKYTRGVVGLRVGSETYPGAAVLSAYGANSGLAGMVRYVGSALEAVRSVHPEVVGDGRVQAWVVGSGGGEGAAEALAAALADAVPVVVDADALVHLPRPAGVPALLTPHAGELATLLDVPRGDVESAPLEHAREAARVYDAAVLLKGRRTLVAEPSGRVHVNVTGTPWLGTAGAGDVLGGVCGALLASGLTPALAGAVGAWLTGAAATRLAADGPLTASAVARALPAVARDLIAEDGR